MSNSAHLRTHDDLLDDIQELVGAPECNPIDLHGALSRAMKQHGNRLRAQFLVDLDPFTAGRCEYPLPCCGIDDIIPEVASRGCGCGNACFHRLPWWEVRGDSLIVPRCTSGYGRATVWARNPEPLEDTIKLAVAWRPGLDVVLDGKVDNLPPLGWVRIGNDWLQYTCVSHEVYRPTLISDTVKLSTSDIIEGTIDPTTVIRETDLLQGSRPSNCFTTILHNPVYHCNGGTGCSYPAGREVEFGVAAMDPSAFDAILSSAMQWYYIGNLTQCAGTVQREIAQQGLQLFAQIEGGQRRSFSSLRKPTVKFRGFKDASCYGRC